MPGPQDVRTGVVHAEHGRGHLERPVSAGEHLDDGARPGAAQAQGLPHPQPREDLCEHLRVGPSLRRVRHAITSPSWVPPVGVLPIASAANARTVEACAAATSSGVAAHV